jgi:hypothetical protein
MTLKAKAKRLVPANEGGLYSTAPPAAHDASLVALPYYLWANRSARLDAGMGGRARWLERPACKVSLGSRRGSAAAFGWS